MHPSLTIGSLFSGIGGLELGLERAGLGPVLWQVECDGFCREVLAKHWPNATRYEDVRAVGPDLAHVDIICGGFPCQDISLAGSGAGLAGERSGLWSEYARIVRELLPRFVVIENVSALLGRGLGTVLGDLAESGYDALWDCIPAQAIGAPHRRDRLFVVAWRVSDAERDGVRIFAERGDGPARQADARHAKPVPVGAVVADGDSHGRESERGRWVLDGERATQRNDANGCGGEAVAHRDGEVRGLAGVSEPGHRSAETQCGTKELGRRGCDRPFPPAPNDLHAWGQVPPDSQPSVCRLADGATARLVRRRDKLKALGNAVVPQVAEVVGHVIAELAKGKVTA